MSPISRTQTDFGAGTGAGVPAPAPVPAARGAAPRAWTVKSMLEWTRDFLGRKGIEQPRLSAEWLLCSATGLSRVELYMNYDRPLEAHELAQMHDAVLRRAKGEPLQYVTGEMPFRHIVLRCAPGVLIPRPETEILVDEVLAYVRALPSSQAPSAAPAAPTAPAPAGPATAGSAPAGPAATPTPLEGEGGAVAAGRVGGEPGDGVGVSAGADDPTDADVLAGADDPRRAGAPAEPAAPATFDFSSQWPADAPRDVSVLEVGTGTGCIALSLAGESPRVRVTATDISPEAVDLARRNRDALGLGDCVDVVECDLADGVDGAGSGAFDILVSNPPYIPTAVLPTLPHEVGDYEPALALDGGADGLDVFRRLVDLGTRALRPGGLLACELFEDSLVAASELPALRASYDNIRIVRDLTGRNRHLVATLREAQSHA